MAKVLLVLLTMVWMGLLLPSAIMALGADNVMRLPGMTIPVGPLLARAVRALPMVLTISMVLAWILYAKDAYRDGIAVAIALPTLHLAVIAGLWYAH